MFHGLMFIAFGGFFIMFFWLELYDYISIFVTDGRTMIITVYLTDFA